MRWSKVLSWVVLGGLALGVVLMLGLVTYQQGVAAREAAQQHAEIVALQAGLEEANERLEAEGEPPVPVPTVEPGTDPPQIILGEPGPQGERGYTGATGPQGRTGPPGEVGPSGADGGAGKDSTTPGPAGTNGASGSDGRGIQSMQCATGGWIITYSDGVSAPDPGPCQGPQGVHGEQGPQGATGPQGTAKPGDYTCPDGEVMAGFTVAEDGTVTLACKDDAPPVIDTP